jgi:hypothetical protein
MIVSTKPCSVPLTSYEAKRVAITGVGAVSVLLFLIFTTKYIRKLIGFGQYTQQLFRLVKRVIRLSALNLVQFHSPPMKQNELLLLE